MGNFSRTTFDPAKNYVAVRLEQGVPLVDADWNELQDTTRTAVYEALRTALPSVAARDGGLDVTVAGANDLVVSAGRGVADGHPFRLWNALQYSTQRYANAATAAADGVAQAPPLSQPLFPRTDCVYLDTFEREVGSAEDPNLINGAIGLETSTRLRREVVLRVEEASSVPPAPPAGHAFLPIALLNRFGPLNAGQIQDAKTYPLPVGVREQAFAPLLFASSLGWAVTGAFTSYIGFPPYKVVARKPPAQSNAFASLYLPVPDQARLLQVRLRGSAPAGSTVSWRVDRGRHDGGASVQVINDAAFTGAPFDRVASAAAEPPVDNSTTYYLLTVLVNGLGVQTDIYGGSIRYVP